MITVHPIIEGKSKARNIYSQWNEVPATSFIGFRSLVPSINEIESKILSENAKIIEWVSSYEKDFFAGHKSKAKQTQSKIFRKQKIVDNLQIQLNEIKLQIICYFSDFTPKDFQFIELDINKNGLSASNHIITLWSMVLKLANTPVGKLSETGVNSFWFQTKTDAEIFQMESAYNATPRWKRFSKKSKQLKLEIEKAKRSEYKIKNIWLHTTYINKELQDIANDIVREQKQGNFDNLILLLAMLTCEDQSDSKILDEIKDKSVKGYKEKYNRAFKEIYSKRIDIFSNQKKKIDIETVFAIRDFFLLNLN